MVTFVKMQIIFLFRFSETSLEKGDKINPPVVVIMLGWAGCKDRYLDKYSAIYLQKVNIIFFVQKFTLQLLSLSLNERTILLADSEINKKKKIPGVVSSLFPQKTYSEFLKYQMKNQFLHENST